MLEKTQQWGPLWFYCNFSVNISMKNKLNMPCTCTKCFKTNCDVNMNVWKTSMAWCRNLSSKQSTGYRPVLTHLSHFAHALVLLYIFLNFLRERWWRTPSALYLVLYTHSVTQVPPYHSTDQLNKSLTELNTIHKELPWEIWAKTVQLSALCC